MPVTRRVLVYSVEEIKGLLVNHFTKKLAKDKIFLQLIVENRAKVPNVGAMTTNEAIACIMDEIRTGGFKFDGRLAHDAIMVFKADSDSYLTLWEKPKPIENPTIQLSIVQ